MLTGNKGEWSEVYTLLKILSDGHLYPGDRNLLKIEQLIFPIIKVLREESEGTFEYSFEDNLIVISGNEEIYKIPIVEFHQNATKLFTDIKSASLATFPVPEVQEFINSFGCRSVKADSKSKNDIKVVIHDLRTGTTPELGFSIKSQLGGASTLLNAGKTTNFIYEIEGTTLSEQEITTINNIDTRSKIKDRIEKIRSFGGRLSFQGTEKSIFGNNLVLIDSALPQIIAELLVIFFTSNSSKIEDLILKIIELNPLKFDLTNSHPFYEYKLKRFLTDIALGMMPSKVWSGKLETTGGYLIVKETGEVICYHIYNRNEFEDYLLNNTKFDTASSERHEFGRIYKSGSKLFFNLNLQIRFLK